jgi:BirA family transcriptional regulator, biotin operon repressor / biotin---[acetyl-CoA-carboxylase] ligase
MTGLSKRAVERLDSPLARRVDFHEEIGSTQERARELAHAGAPHGTLVISRVQIGGRGRLGRRWGSPSGGLWISLILRPRIPATRAPLITQAAAVGVAKALRTLGVEARIKWPNDVLVSGRKICGILAESGLERSRLNFIVLGVGVNANLDRQDLQVSDREITTIRSEIGRDVDLLVLLGSLLGALEFEVGRLEDFGAVLDDWRVLECTLGERVRARRFGETLVGRAVDLSPNGALLLETATGTVELFEGEIEHLRQED